MASSPRGGEAALSGTMEQGQEHCHGALPLSSGAGPAEPGPVA
ncbi:hypothetical protein [Streptomyces flavalbus]|uniref:Uncharacterized protein n=1 Tax=Streptomyces flavalbus TaxID=2665155 RepID=A0ABW2WE84_9ACTN